MKISIITVCMNSEKTIEQTIKSVVNQKYENLEYIIIDGKSNDKTLEIIEKYKDNISMVISESDKGIYDAMNKGINLASGDIIGIINSDDWYEEGVFCKVVKCFKETNAELVYGRLNLVDEQEKIGIITPSNLEKIRYEMEAPHPTVFIKKEIYQRYGMFDLEYKIAADYDLILRLYISGVYFEYLNEVIANFRLSGISNQKKMLCAEETFAIAQKYLDYALPEKKEYIRETMVINYKASCFSRLLSEEKEYIFRQISNECQRKGKCDIAIWGSGKWGIQIYEILMRYGIQPVFFIDNNEDKWSTELKGAKVLNPQALHGFDGMILVMVKGWSKEIKSQIVAMNNQQLECIEWEKLCENEY